MKIVQLNLTGFKSFRSPTSIYFDKGITGVVGPNGCGKSNIVDAILWVCGSGAASQLRGQQMEDVIFSGTNQFTPSSFAEVSLTFEKDDSPNWPEGYEKLNEIVIGRKIKRGGDSQYFLNGEPCLLRNIQEMMMSVGAMGFSVVEQGTVSQMVSYKPDQVRELIDQVAGTSQFKNKKRLTQNKLKVTQQNILRMGDVLSEQKKQLNRLEKQSRQAQEYKTLKEKIDRIETKTLQKNYLKIQKSIQEKTQLMNQILKTEKTSKNEAGSLEENYQKFKKESQNLYSHLESKRKDVANTFEKVTQCEMEIQKLKVSVDSKSGYATQLTSDISYFKNFQTKKEKEIAQLNLQIQKDQSQLVRFNQELENRQAQLEKIQLQQNLIEKEKENKNLELEKSLKQEIQFQEGMKSLEKDQKRIQEFIQSNQEELKKKEGQCVLAQRSCKKLSTQVAEFEKEHLNIQEEIRSQKENISNKESIQKKNDQELEKVCVSLVQKESKKKTFISLREKIGSQTSGYEWLKKEKSYPVLYEMLEIDKGYEKAVQAVLNQHLYSFVVENLKEVESVLKKIHQSSLSRVQLVFPLKQNSFSLFKNSKPKEFECFLRDKVRCKKGFEKYHLLLDLLLKNVAVVRSLNEFSNTTCVTLKGDVLASGCMVSGGSFGLESSDLFKEIDVLKDQIQNLSQQKIKLEQRKNELNTQLKNLHLKKDDLVQKQLSKDQSLRERKREFEYLQKQISFFKEEIQTLYTKLKNQESDLENCQNIQLQKKDQYKSDVSKSSLLKDSLFQTVQKFNKNTEQKNKFISSINQLNLQALSLNKDLKNKTNQIQILQQSMEEISKKEKEFLSKLDQNQEQVGQNSSQIKHLEEQLKKSKENYCLTVEKQESLEKLYQEKVESEQELEKKISKNQLEVQGCLDQKHELETDIQVLQSERKNLEEKSFENFEMDLKSFAKENLSEDSDVEGEEGDVDLEFLKRQISRMGQVNLLALREYEELCEENQKLQSQLDDLNQSKLDLEKIIDEMDRVSNKKFKQAFEEVNSNFQRVFSAVFGGGKAHLTLDTDQGIEIFVCPPGKKLKNLKLLSGGEKSLTALCMILALFLVRPAPFCVFDEVDAALDDQNVVRFNSLMLEIAKKCPIILVTHNKYSMKECDRLYGVTMEDKGITQLLSVEMNQVDSFQSSEV